MLYLQVKKLEHYSDETLKNYFYTLRKFENYIKKPMRECTGKEITEEWLYHLGVPEDKIAELVANSSILF